jgi:N-methylhydantoinase A
VHGTTIATNAVLEHDGAVTGMVTTRGYRDIVHIGRHQRPQNYSIPQEIPWQDRVLVQRRHRKIVSERRVPPHGEVLIPLHEDEVRQAARELKAAGVEAIAVCFLFSYIDPSHEEREVAEQLQIPEIIILPYPGITSAVGCRPRI